jgi:cytoskeletal protein CcmA (bactofilin family)
MDARSSSVARPFRRFSEQAGRRPALGCPLVHALPGGLSVLNFNRNDRMPETPQKDTKPAARPNPLAATPSIPPSPSPMSATPVRPAAVPAAASEGAPAEPKGSKLSIGPNINLKGVEISNCDVIVIEGNVDATINSKVMEIGQPGRLNGTAIIDIAEIHGDFSGELTARAKLVVHATGRVTGTVRYGKLVVAEGGIVSGELKQLDAPAEAHNAPAAPATPGSPRPLLNPQPH